jgi:ABC-type iron transport system FetAB permease component
VVYMLISAVTISSVLTTILAKQQYFTRDHQLAEMLG